MRWPSKGGRGPDALYQYLGWGGLVYKWAWKLSRRPWVVGVRVPGLRHRLYLRTHSTDIGIFAQLLRQQALDLAFVRKPRVFVDCGANFGLASVQVANQFRGCRIVAVESEAGNCQLAERNLRRYRNATVVHAAVWSGACELAVVDPGFLRAACAYQVREPEAAAGDGDLGRVSGLTIDELMRQHGLESIDLLKVDIEGAEAEVFRDASAWIDRVGVVAVECHDRLGAPCRPVVERALEAFPVRFSRGDMLIYAREGRLKPTRRAPRGSGKWRRGHGGAFGALGKGGKMM